MNNIYATGFAKRGLYHAIINIEKSCFEILITVMHAWCPVYTILHQSAVIQGNSVGVPFNGLIVSWIARPNFFHHAVPQGVVGSRWWGVTKWWGATK